MSPRKSFPRPVREPAWSAASSIAEAARAGRCDHFHRALEGQFERLHGVPSRRRLRAQRIHFQHLPLSTPCGIHRRSAQPYVL